jgi:hypothetical protein
VTEVSCGFFVSPPANAEVIPSFILEKCIFDQLVEEFRSLWSMKVQCNVHRSLSSPDSCELTSSYHI